MSIIGRIAKAVQRWDDSRDGLGANEIKKIEEKAAAHAAFTRAHQQGYARRPLPDIVNEAWGAGQALDLANIGYGPVHWNTGERFRTRPDPYYFFLAGLVRSQGFRRIFEVGTHYGGSALAMMRGFAEPESARIVTVDISDRNAARHRVERRVRRAVPSQ